MEKILYIRFGDKNDMKLVPFLKPFEREGCEIEIINVPWRTGKGKLIIYLFLRSHMVYKNDIILTTDYNISFVLNLILVLLNMKRKRHYIIGMNQSSRLWTSPIRFIKRFMDKIFSRSNRIVVYSQEEITLFSDIHKIDRDKFSFVHWGYDLPVMSSNKFDSMNNMYFCMIGRNNRDFKTFCDALTSLGVQGIIIAPNYAVFDFHIPKNVAIYNDLSFDECLNCIKNSIANVVLLQDELRGAGHITIVSSMLLKKSQIVSEVKAIKDYFVDKEHGWAVPLHDVDAIRNVMSEVIESKKERDRRGVNGYDYAKLWLSSEYNSSRIYSLLKAFIENKNYEPVDLNWLRYKEQGR